MDSKRRNLLCSSLLQGKKISTLQVGFATNATVYDSTPTQSDISSKVTGTGNSTSSSSTSNVLSRRSAGPGLRSSSATLALPWW